MGSRMTEEVSLFNNRTNDDPTDCFARLYVPVAVAAGLNIEAGDFVQIGTFFYEKIRYGKLQFIKKRWLLGYLSGETPEFHYSFHERKNALAVDWSIPDGFPWYEDRENRAIRLPILQSRPAERYRTKQRFVILPGKLVFGFMTGWVPFTEKIRTREFHTELID